MHVFWEKSAATCLTCFNTLHFIAWSLLWNVLLAIWNSFFPFGFTCCNLFCFSFLLFWQNVVKADIVNYSQEPATRTVNSPRSSMCTIQWAFSLFVQCSLAAFAQQWSCWECCFKRKHDCSAFRSLKKPLPRQLLWIVKIQIMGPHTLKIYIFFWIIFQ